MNRTLSKELESALRLVSDSLSRSDEGGESGVAVMDAWELIKRELRSSPSNLEPLREAYQEDKLFNEELEEGYEMNWANTLIQVDALLSSPTVGVPQDSPWLSMATAPRDGTPILVDGCPDSEDWTAKVFWENEYEYDAYRGESVKTFGGWLLDVDEPNYIEWEPSGWKPIPPPPSDKSADPGSGGGQ